MSQSFQHLRTLIAAIKASAEANAAYTAAASNLKAAIVTNSAEYDLAALLGDPYPEAVYDAMDDLKEASENVLCASFDHVHALAAATSHVQARAVQ
jgi:transcription termination factor Rho